MNVQHVPVDFIQKVWPDVADFFAPAVAKFGEQDGYTLDQIRTLLATGVWMLVVVTDEDKPIGALAIDFINRPTQRVAFVTCIGGKGLANEEAYAMLVRTLKMFGATHIEGAVTDAVAKLWQRLGLTEKYKIVGAKL